MPSKQFKVGGDRNFGYLAWDEESNEAFIVDPAYSPEMIINSAKKNGYIIKYIFNTHGHFDHTNGNAGAQKLTGLKPFGFGDVEPISGKIVKDNLTLPLGSKQIQILYTPGHTDDSICILFEDNLFTGDTLFVGKVGGTGFGNDASDEYKSLHEKLMTLPEKTKVFPGHDYGITPQSTIGKEKKNQSFHLAT